MRKQQELSPAPAFDYEKSAAARAAKREEKAAAGLELNWTRKQAILAWCHQCMNNQPAEVRRCESFSCPLWPFRTRRTVTAAEMKKWESHFRNSADGQRFLKEDATEEDGADTSAELADLPSEEAW